jgi:hypothetical protein
MSLRIILNKWVEFGYQDGRRILGSRKRVMYILGLEEGRCEALGYPCIYLVRTSLSEGSIMWL